MDALLQLYASKHERRALAVAERRGHAGLAARFGGSLAQPQQPGAAGGAAAAAAVPAVQLGSPSPSRRRRHSSCSGGSPAPPSTLRRRPQPELERPGASPPRVSPAKSMR